MASLARFCFTSIHESPYGPHPHLGFAHPSFSLGPHRLCVGLGHHGQCGWSGHDLAFSVGLCRARSFVVPNPLGLLGGHWSRWTQFPLQPAGVWAYVQGRHPSRHFAGHNPLGSWSVLALLLVLALQGSTGLISDDEIANMGPLSSLVSASWVSWATSWHKGWGKTILIFLVVLHLLALAWYTWRKRQALVSAMWHGDKALPHETTATRDNGPSRAMALLLLAISVLAVFGLVSLGA